MRLNLPTLAEIEQERAGKALTKPSKVARLEKKAETKAAMSKARAKAEKADKARLAAIREACFMRDHGRCRSCNRELELMGVYALKVAHAHHLTYRSQQGSDELSNRCILCPKCHEAEHLGKLEISGDPNGVLRFTERQGESGKAGRTWTSEVPR